MTLSPEQQAGVELAERIISCGISGHAIYGNSAMKIAAAYRSLARDYKAMDEKMETAERHHQRVYSNASKSVAMLEKAGMGKVYGRGNCLVDMVEEICESLAESTRKLKDWNRSASEICPGSGFHDDPSRVFAHIKMRLETNRELAKGNVLLTRKLSVAVKAIQGMRPAGSNLSAGYLNDLIDRALAAIAGDAPAPPYEWRCGCGLALPKWGTDTVDGYVRCQGCKRTYTESGVEVAWNEDTKTVVPLSGDAPASETSCPVCQGTKQVTRGLVGHSEPCPVCTQEEKRD